MRSSWGHVFLLLLAITAACCFRAAGHTSASDGDANQSSAQVHQLAVLWKASVRFTAVEKERAGCKCLTIKHRLLPCIAPGSISTAVQ
jgi:hypothetical protein